MESIQIRVFVLAFKKRNKGKKIIKTHSRYLSNIQHVELNSNT